jgi:hypothetical protein
MIIRKLLYLIIIKRINTNNQLFLKMWMNDQ